MVANDIDFSQISSMNKTNSYSGSSGDIKYNNSNEKSFNTHNIEHPVIDFSMIKFNSSPGNKNNKLSQSVASPNHSIKSDPKQTTSIITSLNDFSISKALQSLSDIDFTNPKPKPIINSANNINTMSTTTFINPDIMSLNFNEVPTRQRAVTTNQLNQPMQTLKSYDFHNNNPNPMNFSSNQSLFFADSSRKSQEFANLNNILSNSFQGEDVFDKNQIKKQLRGAIIVN